MEVCPLTYEEVCPQTYEEVCPLVYLTGYDNIMYVKKCAYRRNILHMDIRDMQQEVDKWIGQFEEGYWTPLSMLARLMEEVGELAREINHQFGQKTKKPEEPEGNIALELADILFILICYANSQQIDLETAFQQVMEKYRKRDSNRWTRKEG
jgi:NTP pyrophosphatase (non-canonical NTP hydrolase)